jgi:hypothetical protein
MDPPALWLVPTRYRPSTSAVACKSSRLHGRPDSSWIATSRAPGRVWCQHHANATYAILAFDSRLRRKKAQALSHAPRYHPPMRRISGPTIINWSMTPTICMISIKAHAAISF